MKENYESFYERVAPLFAPKDLVRIDLAYVLAKHSHQYQTRKYEKDEETGEPVRYFEHPRRVAIILLDDAGCRDVDLVIAGLLHDGAEDTRFLTRERIEQIFGPKVAAIVNIVTKRPVKKGGYKPDYVGNLKRFGSWRDLLLKSCDQLDNQRTLSRGSPEFQRKQLLETRTKYYPLFNLMVERVPKRWSEGAQTVRKMIHNMVIHNEEQLAKLESGEEDD